MFRRKTEKYITFLVPVKKELDNSKKITYKLNFIDGFRFMQTSLSSLVNNISKTYSKKCSYKCMWDFIGFKYDILYYECKECKKGY